jgi:hypothetical protein
LKEQLSIYRCSYCNSELLSSQPVEFDEKNYGSVESFRCGFETGGHFERPCPFGPHFPKLKDFELRVEDVDDGFVVTRTR